jgi:hypothetical protein
VDSISGMLGDFAACLTCWFGDAFKGIASAAMSIIDDWEEQIQAAATIFVFYAFNRAIAAAIAAAICEILKTWKSMEILRREPHGDTCGLRTAP